MIPYNDGWKNRRRSRISETARTFNRTEHQLTFLLTKKCLFWSSPERLFPEETLKSFHHHWLVK
jgi:hypothetical protein